MQGSVRQPDRMDFESWSGSTVLAQYTVRTVGIDPAFSPYSQFIVKEWLLNEKQSHVWSAPAERGPVCPGVR